MRLTVEQPHSLRAPDVVDRLTRISPDVMVVVAYGLIVPAPRCSWDGVIVGKAAEKRSVGAEGKPQMTVSITPTLAVVSVYGFAYR